MGSKARIVDALEDEMVYVEEFVIKVTRPYGDPPAFWVEDEGGEVKLAFAFDSEQGKCFAALIGVEGTTYHTAFITIDGEFAIEAEELGGYSW